MWAEKIWVFLYLEKNEFRRKRTLSPGSSTKLTLAGF
jgi:hypothetical protein